MADIRFILEEAEPSDALDLIVDMITDIIEKMDKLTPPELRGQVSVQIFDSGDGYGMEMTSFKRSSALVIPPSQLERGNFNYTLERRIDLKKGIMDLEAFVIAPELQGKGLSRVVHKTQLDYSKKLGIKRYNLSANLQVGGYAWLKAGMAPTDPEVLRRAYTTVYRKAREWNQNFQEYGTKASTTMEALKLELDDIPDAKLIAAVRKNPSKYKELFIGSNWTGSIDLNDKQSLGMLKDYIDPPLVAPVVPLKKLPEVKVTTPKDMVIRRQVHLEQLKTGLALEYQEMLRLSNQDIRNVLRGMEKDTLKDLTQSEFKALMADLRSSQQELYVDQLNQLASNLEGLALNEALFEAALLKEAFEEVKMATRVWQAAIREPIQSSGELLAPFLDGLSARQIQRMENQMRLSRARGMTIDQTVRAFNGTKAKGYKDGILGKNWSDARTVIRTATQHVSSASRNAMWVANSDIMDSYQWVSTLDGVTSDVCKSLDGKVFKIGQGPLPPIHPNCRSTTVPYFPPSRFDDGATRSSLHGYVDVNTTYYQWLKDQPEAFQIDALGKTRAKLFREGGLSPEEFGDLQLGNNFQPMTLKQMQEKMPNVFEKAGVTLN